MAGVDILIGSELTLHREALQATLIAMRPDLVIHAVPHDELDTVASELHPLLVISSFAGPSRPHAAAAWITLYPDERDEAVVSIGGTARVIPNATLAQLLAVMDGLGTTR